MRRKKGSKPKAAILTWCDNNGPTNYGQIFQCYAMQHLVKKAGFEPLVVQYRRKDSGDICKYHFSNRTVWGRFINEKYEQYFNWKVVEGEKTLRVIRFKQFIKKYIPLSPPCYTKSMVEEMTKDCRVLICGSDQIWNPDITGGLRKAYFGAFTNNRKEKVIAYAASIGGVSLPPVYNREFSCLLKCVDVISVREKEAIPYIKSLYEGSVIDVLDPVLLLNKEEWLHIEKQPDRERYIFVYLTEKNMELMTYVKKLSKQKGLSIINLWSSVRVVDKEFIIDYIAGPAEFLGYLHQADYVVTNSFHVVVFSIIYQKKFTAFQHSKLGARINNVLRIHGLEHRLYGTDSLSRIDDVVDWEAVKKRTEKKVRISTEFLLDHVGI